MSQEEYIAHLEQTVKSLEQQVSNLTEMILLLNKKQFGASSEKTPRDKVLENQLRLEAEVFNEAEMHHDPKFTEPPLTELVVTKKPKTKVTREKILQNLPVEEIEYVLEGEDKLCPWCKTEMVPIGKEQVRQELQFIPAQLKVINYIRYAYECPECKKDGESVIEKAPTPPPVLKHSLASPSSVAHVMYQKYVNALPLYRQAQDWLN